MASSQELILANVTSVRGHSKDASKVVSLKDQIDLFDSSLTNLFDSLNKPLVHENKFDLTQRINENFKEILQSINTKIESEDSKAFSEDELMIKVVPQSNQNPNLETPYFLDKRHALPEEEKHSRKSRKKQYLRDEYRDEYLAGKHISGGVKKRYIKDKNSSEMHNKKSPKVEPYPQSQSSAAVFGPVATPI
jgi:hypothetical protein